MRGKKKNTPLTTTSQTTSEHTAVQYNAMFKKKELDEEFSHHQRLRYAINVTAYAATPFACNNCKQRQEELKIDKISSILCS